MRPPVTLETPPAPTPPPVIESGPVAYDEPTEEEDDEEVEEPCVSAMKLMGGNGQYKQQTCSEIRVVKLQLVIKMAVSSIIFLYILLFI